MENFALPNGDNSYFFFKQFGYSGLETSGNKTLSGGAWGQSIFVIIPRVFQRVHDMWQYIRLDAKADTKFELF